MKKIINFIMLAFTLIYSVFMVNLSGAGLIYNKSGYGAEIAAVGVFLIISGILMTSGAFLSLSGKKFLNIISVVSSISGLVLCLVMLYILCSHADKSGWRDNYTLAPVSGMYRERILPVIIPACMSLIRAILNIKNNRT